MDTGKNVSLFDGKVVKGVVKWSSQLIFDTITNALIDDKIFLKI